MAKINFVQAGGVGWVFDRFGNALRNHVDQNMLITPHAVPGYDRYIFIAPQYSVTATQEQMNKAIVHLHHVNPFPPHDLATKLPMLRRARKVVVSNEIMARELRKEAIFPAVIHHGIDTEMFKPGSLRIVGDRFCVGICGRNHPDGRKAPTRIASILIELGKRMELKAVFCGVDWDPVVHAVNAACTGCVAAKYNDKLMDYAEYPKFYRTIDALLIASETEGGPYPALEALASGVPVVSTPVGYMPELCVPEIGNVMLYSEPGSAVKALRMISQNVPNQRDIAATVSDWTWESACRRWKQLLV